MAVYSDWEIHSANAQDMQTAVNFLGFTQGDGFLQGNRYSIPDLWDEVRSAGYDRVYIFRWEACDATKHGRSAWCVRDFEMV
jgi:hypothetical protein